MNKYETELRVIRLSSYTNFVPVWGVKFFLLRDTKIGWNAFLHPGLRTWFFWLGTSHISVTANNHVWLVLMTACVSHWDINFYRLHHHSPDMKRHCSHCRLYVITAITCWMYISQSWITAITFVGRMAAPVEVSVVVLSWSIEAITVLWVRSSRKSRGDGADIHVTKMSLSNQETTTSITRTVATIVAHHTVGAWVCRLSARACHARNTIKTDSMSTRCGPAHTTGTRRNTTDIATVAHAIDTGGNQQKLRVNGLV